MARRREEGKKKRPIFRIARHARARSGFLPSIGGPTNSLTIPHYLGEQELVGQQPICSRGNQRWDQSGTCENVSLSDHFFSPAMRPPP